MILIGGEKERWNAQCEQVVAYVVSGEDPQAIEIARACGRCREQEETLDLIAVRMRRLQSSGREASYQLHGAPRHELQSGNGQVQLESWGDTRERIQDNKIAHALRMRERKAHRQRSTERFANDNGRGAIGHRAVEMSRDVGDKRVHVQRLVTKAKRDDTKTVGEQAYLPVKQQAGPVEARDVNQRRSFTVHVQPRGIIRLQRRYSVVGGIVQ